MCNAFTPIKHYFKTFSTTHEQTRSCIWRCNHVSILPCGTWKVIIPTWGQRKLALCSCPCDWKFEPTSQALNVTHQSGKVKLWTRLTVSKMKKGIFVRSACAGISQWRGLCFLLVSHPYYYSSKDIHQLSVARLSCGARRTIDSVTRCGLSRIDPVEQNSMGLCTCEYLTCCSVIAIWWHVLPAVVS